jgi:hypothetical protein
MKGGIAVSVILEYDGPQHIFSVGLFKKIIIRGAASHCCMKGRGSIPMRSAELMRFLALSAENRGRVGRVLVL